MRHKHRRSPLKKAKRVALGTTLGAVLAASAAAYFFTQTKAGKKTVQTIKEHATHVSKEISHRVAKVRTLTKVKYEEIVDEIVDEYAGKKKIASKQVIELKNDLKAHWKDVQREVKKSKVKPKATAKKSTAKKKVVKKPAVKKTTKKSTKRRS